MSAAAKPKQDRIRQFASLAEHEASVYEGKVETTQYNGAIFAAPSLKANGGIRSMIQWRSSPKARILKAIGAF